MTARRLEGKTALVTGAGRGIGRAIAVGFAREGAQVMLSGRAVPGLESAAAEVRAAGGRAIVEPCDVSVEAQADALAAAAEAAFGRVDVLVNAAGILGPRMALAEVETRELEAVWRANLLGPFLVARALLKRGALKDGAVVLNLSSGQGRKAGALWGPYSSSKFALEGLTQSWAEELKDRVRFHAVDPGPVRTPMRAAARPDEDPKTVKPPESVVEAFVALACGAANPGVQVSLDRATGKLL